MMQEKTNGGHNNWGCVMIPGIILIVLSIIVVLYPKMHLISLDGDVYKNDCLSYENEGDMKKVVSYEHIDLDNLKLAELSEADSMTLTFQFKFPFMFSIPDNAEMLIYLRRTHDDKILLYDAPLPENHKTTFRVPKIHEYPTTYYWEFWLISHSALRDCRWTNDEFIDFENENSPHNYRVKLLTRAYEYDNPYGHPYAPLRTTIFTPM